MVIGSFYTFFYSPLLTLVMLELYRYGLICKLANYIFRNFKTSYRSAQLSNFDDFYMRHPDFFHVYESNLCYVDVFLSLYFYSEINIHFFLIYKCTNIHPHNTNIVLPPILAFSTKPGMIRVKIHFLYFSCMMQLISQPIKVSKHSLPCLPLVYSTSTIQITWMGG